MSDLSECLMWLSCVHQDNLFEWHFSVRGPPDSDFDGGVYHGRIVLPPEYPMKPPSIILLTVRQLLMPPLHSDNETVFWGVCFCAGTLVGLGLLVTADSWSFSCTSYSERWSVHSSDRNALLSCECDICLFNWFPGAFLQLKVYASSICQFLTLMFN